MLKVPLKIKKSANLCSVHLDAQSKQENKGHVIVVPGRCDYGTGNKGANEGRSLPDLGIGVKVSSHLTDG